MDTNLPGGARAGAVSLTFDDGRASQLEKAVPLLDRYGLRATFYLGPNGDDWRERFAPWRDVAARGHELGNHTLSHIGPANLVAGPRAGDAVCLERITLDDIERDILAAQGRLAELAPHQQQWTFAYPCYCTDVGRGASRRSYVPMIAKHFRAGRGGGEYGFGNNPHGVDLACVWGLAVERMTGPHLIGLVEEIASRGYWAVLVFHDLDGPRLTVGSYEFRILLDYLKREESRIWTAPVVEVAPAVAEFQAGLALLRPVRPALDLPGQQTSARKRTALGAP